MLLIATDEAGYGPKLGPLIVAASMWRIPTSTATEDDLAERFSLLREPISIGDSRVVIDDSISREDSPMEEVIRVVVNRKLEISVQRASRDLVIEPLDNHVGSFDVDAALHAAAR